MRTFFGSTFIEKDKLKEAEIYYPIKLEYYKEINEDEIQKDNTKYGITIVKTEYMENNLKVETKNIKYITNDEREEEKILNIFKENKVTPINSEEVISDILIGELGRHFSTNNFGKL